MGENTIGWIPHDVEGNQLDRFLETLQILTSCLFVGVTVDELTELMTV